MRILTFYRNFFKEIRPWFIAVLLWFFVCSVIGFVTFLFYPGLLQNIITLFQDKIGEAQSWHLFWAIFINNVTVSIVVIVTGLVAGLVPVVMIGFNGFLLGYIVCAVIQESGGTIIEKLVFIVGSLFPHGIIELPLIMVSAVVGLRLGIRWVFEEVSSKRGWSVFKKDVMYALAIVPVLVVGLGVAALLEAFLTSHIVDFLLS